MARRIDPEEARSIARQILSGARFQPPSERTRPPRRRPDLDRFIPDEAIGRFLANDIVLLLLAVAVVGLTVWLCVRAVRQRAPRLHEESAEATTRALDDPDALDRLAAAADANGEYAAAIRYRFRAGLLRLDRSGALQLRASTTSAQAARTVRSETFDGLARQFDAVAYGDARAAGRDSERSSHDWRAVLQKLGDGAGRNPGEPAAPRTGTR